MNLGLKNLESEPGWIPPTADNPLEKLLRNLGIFSPIGTTLFLSINEVKDLSPILNPRKELLNSLLEFLKPPDKVLTLIPLEK